MGSWIFPIIEYDTCGEDTPPSPPFSQGADYIDLTDFNGLVMAKDYRFIAAISGNRNESRVEPLYARRGYPANLHPGTHERLDSMFDESQIGWLTLNEIEAALAHMGYDRNMLCWKVNLVLEMMTFLVNRMTNDYVRLVFAVD